jgi:hypothetical protein
MIDVATSGGQESRCLPCCVEILDELHALGPSATVTFTPFMFMMLGMRYKIRFLWNATKGHRLAPWRSPYLLWRIETYTGVKMTQIGFLEFWEFMWRERRELWGFLKWTGEMERWVHPKPKNP